MKQILLSLALLFTSTQAISQQAWTNFTTSNSQISDNSIRCILFENDSTTWIGTDFGLSKLVNGNWTSYNTSNSNIPANGIRSLAIDSLNTIWVGTFSNGLASFDGTTWTSYNTLNSPLPDDFVRSLAVDTLGQKWIGTTAGLAKIDSLNNWTIYTMWNSILGSNNIACIYVDTLTDNKWVGTVNGGVLLIEKDTNLTTYTVQNSGISDNTILSIDMDSLNNVYMASPANGLIVKLAGFGWFTYNLVSSNIPTAGLTSVSFDLIDKPWMGSFDKGLLYKDGNNFIMYDTANSPLTDVMIQCVRVNDSGKVWIGTQTGGLYILDPSLLTGIQQPDGATNVNVYPNPAAEIVYIQSRTGISMLEVSDLNGRHLVQDATGRNEIVLSSFTKGVYQLKIHLEDGSVIVKKLIKQ